ncbi:MAG: hypothetical protein AB4080_18365 [Trichodesmium sp.]
MNFVEPRQLYERYIKTHAQRINNPEISQAQKANCKWRIAEVLNFEQKYNDFDREHCTLTQEQEAEVMGIVAEFLTDD